MPPPRHVLFSSCQTKDHRHINNSYGIVCSLNHELLFTLFVVLVVTSPNISRAGALRTFENGLDGCNDPMHVVKALNRDP